MVKEFVVTKKEAILLLQMLILNKELHKRAMLKVSNYRAFMIYAHNLHINTCKRLINDFGENSNKYTAFYKNADEDIYKIFGDDFNEIFNLLMNNEVTIPEEMCPIWEYSEVVLKRNKQFRLTKEMIDLYTKLDAMGFYEFDLLNRMRNPEIRDSRRKMTII